MKFPILSSFVRCPYAMRARMALKIAGIKCEIREIRLSDKPQHMLKVSPKGTVPILILKDKIIDESIDIINWVNKKNNIFDRDVHIDMHEVTEDIIFLFDNQFKFHLDRYKYSERFKDSDRNFHRTECINILMKLEGEIKTNNWIFGDKINKLDISILPFIRQFRISDPDWFDNQIFIPKVKNLLQKFTNSKLFKDIMFKYDIWKDKSPTVYFP